MYRATLIFSYSFSLSGYYTYFWYPIPLSQVCLGYFLSFSASIPFLPLRPGISYPFRPLYPFSRCALGISYPFWPPYPFCRCAPGISRTFRPPYPSCRCARVFPILFGLHTFPAAAPGYFLHFSAFHTLAILRFCVCRSLTIHRIA